MSKVKEVLAGIAGLIVVIFVAALDLSGSQRVDSTLAHANTQVPNASQIDLNKLYDLVNQDRLSAHVAPVAEDVELKTSAYDRCNDMAEKGYYSHTDPNGNLWTITLKKYVPYYNGADENIDVNFDVQNAEQINAIFMGSPIHREAILNPEYTKVGLAACNGTYQTKPAVFVVEHFIAPYNQ